MRANRSTFGRFGVLSAGFFFAWKNRDKIRDFIQSRRSTGLGSKPGDMGYGRNLHERRDPDLDRHVL